MSNEVVDLDFLHVGDGGPVGHDSLPEDSDCTFISVMMDDLTDFLWFEPTESCTVEATARYLLL